MVIKPLKKVGVLLFYIDSSIFNFDDYVSYFLKKKKSQLDLSIIRGLLNSGQIENKIWILIIVTQIKQM